MRFQCPFCNNVIGIPDEYRGYRVACSSCDKRIIAPSSPFEEGCVIGDFVIQSKLGEGAIGAVYKAFQLSLERVVALKILSNKHITEEGLIEFQREARAAAKLIHVNLVQSYAVGVDDGIYYMAMTYISGETLKSRIRRTGPIPCDEALHIIQQVAEALHYAWTKSHLIHRDVKPDNIMISEKGIVKLTDLGLAMNQAEWRQGMDISGSPSYMSPEQFGGEKLDTRSDIYSLGVTLYQLLTGELPFDAETIRSIAKQHFEVAVPDVNKKVPGLPSSVGRLIKKMMAKTPEKRFKDMEALLGEIWNIRQETAPNQDMVPDVHTISMRRLDYDAQFQENESVPPSAHALPQEPNHLQKPASQKGYIGILLIIFLLVCVLAVLAISYQRNAMMSANKNDSYIEANHPIYEQLVNFEKLTADTALTYEDLQTSADPLLAAMAQESKMHDSLKNALEYYVLNSLQERLAQRRKEEAAKAAEEQKKNLNQLKLDLETSRNSEALLKKTIDEQQEKIDGQIEKLAELDLVKKDLEETRKKLAHEQKLTSDCMPIVREQINKELLLLWLKQDYTACENKLLELTEMYPYWQEHLTNLKKYNNILAKTAERFSLLKSECAGLVLYAGTVSHFENGLVCCFAKDEAGNINLNKIPWHELRAEDILSLINYEKRVSTTGTEAAQDPMQPLFTDELLPIALAVYNVMNGNCSALYDTAEKYAAATESRTIPESDMKSLLSLADTRSVALAELIRVLCENGKVPIKVLFQRYLDHCRNSPSYQKNLKELKPYFEKKESAKPVDKTIVP